MSTDSDIPSGTRTARSVGDEKGRLRRPFGAALERAAEKPDRPGLLRSRVARISALELKAIGPIKPAEPEVLIARQAAARVEAEDGWHDMAAHRLSGAFDGDFEQRIALATIAVLDEMDLLVEAVSPSQCVG